MKSEIKYYEIVILLSSYIIVSLLCYLFQPPLTYNQGKGWDGQHYFEVAEDIQSGITPSADAPFVYRVGTPFLAQAVSSDIDEGFKIVNHSFSFIATALLYIWFFIKRLPRSLRIGAVLMYILSWIGPARITHYWHIDTDPAAIALIISGLILLELYKERRQYKYLILMSALSFIGVFFREIVIIPAIVMLFIDKGLSFKKFNIKPETKELIPLIAGITGLLIVRLWAEQENDYSFIEAFLKWLYLKPTTKYLHAWFIAFGPIITFLLFDYKNSIKYLKNNRNLACFIIIIAALAWTGGTDTERFAFWSAPATLLLIGLAIDNQKNIARKPAVYLIMGAAQLISMRVFWIIPDYPTMNSSKVPLLTPPNNKFPFLDLWTMHGETWVLVIGFIEYAILTAFLLLLMRHYKQRKEVNDLRHLNKK